MQAFTDEIDHLALDVGAGCESIFGTDAQTRGMGIKFELSASSRLVDRLRDDSSLASSVEASLQDFGQWLTHVGTPLFPFFTDHGPQHVAGVILTAESLISDDSWALLTADDAAALLISVVLHDCAMGISEEGFLDLIGGDWADEGIRVPDLDTEDWPSLWDRFLYSALKWDDRKLRHIFGDGVGGQVSLVRQPPDDAHSWVMSDRLLAGEFVRQHHARVAHEVALAGLPGRGEPRLRLDPGLSQDFRNLAGLIARSHGLALRDVYGYLETYADLRDHGGLHAVFVMVLLRIADFLQVEASRAPEQVLRVKTIRNPYSLGEWDAHRAVKYITVHDQDPEAIRLVAEPPNVQTFLRLREWLEAFQQELDGCWASLGEIYGRFAPLDRFGIVIRRIRSNLDHRDVFDRHWPFVASRVQFQVARPELLELMIRPLYGDRPEVGVRELVQNAVDAVREREDLEGFSEEPAPPTELEDVRVELTPPVEGEPGWIHVTDRGIGMTPQVLIDYFFTAGASYRASEEWKKQFQNEPGGSGPESRVIRSGRFGVGALAAFLLGGELLLETRHVAADVGIRLRTTLDSEAIDLWWDASLAPGTRVSIPLSAETWQRLQKTDWRRSHRRDTWDWFCWRKPIVRRFVAGAVRKQSVVVPQGETAAPPWERLDEAIGFGPVFWTYDAKAPSLTVNGLLVPKGVHGDPLVQAGRIVIPTPKLAVTDPDGLFPLTLQRDEMSGTVPFRDDLIRSILNRGVVSWKVASPGSPSAKAFFDYPGITIDGPWHLYRQRLGPWLILDEGIALFTDAAVASARLSRLVLVTRTYRRSRQEDEHFLDWPVQLGSGVGVTAAGISHQRSESLDDLKWCLFPQRLRVIPDGWNWHITATQVVIPSDLASAMERRKYPQYMDDITRTERVGAWTRITVGDPHHAADLQWLAGHPPDHWSRWLVAWDIDIRPDGEEDVAPSESDVDEMWAAAAGERVLRL